MRNRQAPMWMAHVSLWLLLGLLGGCLAAPPPAQSKHGLEDYFTDPKAQQLGLAAEQGNAKEVRRLMKEEKIDPDKMFGSDGTPLLAWPIIAQSPEGLRAMLENGADPNVKLPYKTLDRGIRFNYNAMVWAAGQEDSTYLKLLLDHGGDPNTRNANNESLLFHTRMQQTSRFNAKLLVEHGADVNAQAQVGTIIEDYAGYGGFEMVYWLLQHGADPSLTYPLDKPLKRPDSSTIQSIFWYPEHPQVRNWQRLCQLWLLDHGFKRPPMSELYRDKRRDCGHSIIEKDVPLVLPLAPPPQGPVEIRVCQPISLLMKEEKERQERNKPSHSPTNQAKD